MEQLWAPWRLNYIVSSPPKGCVFCLGKPEEDESRLVLYRGSHMFVVMNAFPYSNGHLLIPPYRHISDLADLTDDESLEMMQLTRESCRILKETCRPDGFNIGINLGGAAGAGIAEHLHLHIVPRWHSDTNFMPVLADVKVIPEALEATYRKLKEHFDLLR
jgi:ATP adenylyltransferase